MIDDILTLTSESITGGSTLVGSSRSVFTHELVGNGVLARPGDTGGSVLGTETAVEAAVSLTGTARLRVASVGHSVLERQSQLSEVWK
jgi:hypothetical protein